MQNIQIVFLALGIFTLSVIFYTRSFLPMLRMAQSGLVAVDYEVFGRVQGVFFRKFTNEKANSLGLKGWVKNTRLVICLLTFILTNFKNWRDQTVKGQMEGDPSTITEMKNWLQKTGSPMSRIEKAVFSRERQIEQYSFENFKVVHWKPMTKYY